MNDISIYNPMTEVCFMITRRNPKTVHAPVGPYVHQIEVSEQTRVLNLSGQIGMDLENNIPETVEEQFNLALKNIELNLKEANIPKENITKITLYFAEELSRSIRGEILLNFFGEDLPCCTLLYVKALASPQIKVEIDAWVVFPS